MLPKPPTKNQGRRLPLASPVGKNMGSQPPLATSAHGGMEVRLCFGFLPNLVLSIHKNAQEVMGDTSPGCYFLKATSTAFHDPTERKSLPPTATSLLGLSLKIIPILCYAPLLTGKATFLN